MAYSTSTAGSALLAGFTHLHETKFLRRLARASLDHSFERHLSRLQRISIPEIGAGAEVRLRFGPHTWGETPLIDLIALCTLVSAQQPRTIFEFGTFSGNTTLHLAMNAPEDCVVHTLDLAPHDRGTIKELNWEAGIDRQTIGSRFAGTPYVSRIRQQWGDSRTFDTTRMTGQMDFVWVDACHEYDFVVNDSNKAFEMLKPGGVIAWHDLSRACPGVGKHLAHLARSQAVYWIENTQVAFCRGKS